MWPMKYKGKLISTSSLCLQRGLGKLELLHDSIRAWPQVHAYPLIPMVLYKLLLLRLLFLLGIEFVEMYVFPISQAGRVELDFLLLPFSFSHTRNYTPGMDYFTATEHIPDLYDSLTFYDNHTDKEDICLDKATRGIQLRLYNGNKF